MACHASSQAWPTSRAIPWRSPIGFGERALGSQAALVAAGNGLLPAQADLRHVFARIREVPGWKIESTELQTGIRQRSIRNRCFIGRPGIEIQRAQCGLRLKRKTARFVKSEDLPQSRRGSRQGGQQQH